VTIARPYQVPKVAVEVGKYGYPTPGFVYWWPNDEDVVRQKIRIVAPEVIGMQEEEYAASGLVAYTGLLRGRCGFGEEERTTAAAPWRHHYPSFGFGHYGIFHKFEIQFAGIEVYGFVVIIHYECKLCDSLIHAL